MRAPDLRMSPKSRELRTNIAQLADQRRMIRLGAGELLEHGSLGWREDVVNGQYQQRYCLGTLSPNCLDYVSM